MTTINDLSIDRSPREEGLVLVASGQDPSDPTRWMKISVIRDPDPASTPDEEDHLGVFVHGHPRYGLYGTQFRGGLDVKAYFEKEGIDAKTVLSLPVYLLDHSGLALSTKDFHDAWDSGKVGIVYVTADRIVDEYGADNAQSRATATGVLIAEIEEINDYLSGNVYGFRTEEAPAPDGPWEVLEETWGFVGSDLANVGINNHLSDGEAALWLAAVGAPKADPAAPAKIGAEDASEPKRPRP